MSDSSGSDKASAGLGGVAAALSYTIKQAGLVRGTTSLARVNQTEGFDCPGCAWPEGEHRSAFEFCENGAKAVAHEATTKRTDERFFGKWPVSRLKEQTDHWLEAQGRLTHPMHRRAGSDYYEPVSWETAFAILAEKLGACTSPDEAVFYTSGRTSNEAAFLYQLFVRMFGTNNLPDCSNMCHESSGTGLSETIGVGKGTVSLHDFTLADAIFVIGQNPGTNHPRMLSALEQAKRRGAMIVSINPLRERGLVRFTNPQSPRDLLTGGTDLADLFLQVRVGGDVALIKGIMKHVLAMEAAAPGSVLDLEFIERHTTGFDAMRAEIEAASWDTLEEASGISREAMRRAAKIYVEAEHTIACWAMGITQHENGVANVREITNLLMLRGNLGRPGAGACPVRGHSNVQGDRTMGIWEKPKPEFLETLGREVGFEPPREHGMDTVAAVHAMEEGRVRVFFAMGGNFAAATPDTERTHRALERCGLTAHVATKLNRSHLVTGERALLLPCLGRTEIDRQRSGDQFVTVEDSMSMVHRSKGHLEPAGTKLMSEPAVVGGMAKAVLGTEGPVNWDELVGDYDKIRDLIARVVPGFENMNERVRTPLGFLLPNAARDRDFVGIGGKAKFSVNPIADHGLRDGELLLMTMRSHDQFNTTVYGLDDRYRGIEGERDIVFVNAEDLLSLGLANGDRVDVTSRSGRDDVERVIRGFRLVTYDIPRGSVGAYFPEANPLVALESIAEGSRTPAYKSIRVRLTRSAA